MSRTKENLIRFVDFLSQKGSKNTGKPPYTIKAADLDENFQRLTLKVDAADGSSTVPVIEYLPDGQHLSSLTIDVILNGKVTQTVIFGVPIPQNNLQ